MKLGNLTLYKTDTNVLKVSLYGSIVFYSYLVGIYIIDVGNLSYPKLLADHKIVLEDNIL